VERRAASRRFLSAGYRILGSRGATCNGVTVFRHPSPTTSSPARSVRSTAIWPSLSAGALLDYRQAPTAKHRPAPRAGAVRLLVIGPPWTLDSYVSIGLANGSPDVGVGTQLGYTW